MLPVNTTRNSCCGSSSQQMETSCAPKQDEAERCCTPKLDEAQPCCTPMLDEVQPCCGSPSAKTVSCCGSAPEPAQHLIKNVSPVLTAKDRLDAFKVRMGFGRMNSTVLPGLYSLGSPNASSPVLVSANYKLTFDALRKELEGIDCWLLILDTRGINVWCAAGKGTFGTAELVNRIEAVRLADIVEHRELILPQLGAPGVAAHEVKTLSGFGVQYGPVRAADIKAYLQAGKKATPRMRKVRFSLADRAILTPMELLPTLKYLLSAFGALFLLNLFVPKPFGLFDAAAIFGAVVIGSVVAPLLLPLIPGRPFAFKGWLLGLLWAFSVLFIGGMVAPERILLVLGYILLLPAISAFLTMNFTGASTFTSFSGVIKEMKVAVPLIIGSVALGALLLIVQAIVG